jgi:23S rRNA-/tRNA-specific pseudouridylate synthase
LQKKPLIPIDLDPIEVWYEGPSVIAVDKPAGTPVHPQEAAGSGTVLNRLFQKNRWMAQMETSFSAGVIHRFSDQDHGLMIFNKDDKYQEVLEKAYQEGDIVFSYLIQVEGNPSIELNNPDGLNVQVLAQTSMDGKAFIDLQVNTGDTQNIREQLLPKIAESESVFYCYAIELALPHSGERRKLSLRQPSDELPKIIVFHAPP